LALFASTSAPRASSPVLGSSGRAYYGEFCVRWEGAYGKMFLNNY
jgi:hypothetical protein